MLDAEQSMNPASVRGSMTSKLHRTATHHDLIQMLKMNILENDPDGAAIQSFLDGYGISQSEFEQMRPTLESLLLLRAFDKLRWAIDCDVKGLERFIIHARQAVERKLRYISEV